MQKRQKVAEAQRDRGEVHCEDERDQLVDIPES